MSTVYNLDPIRDPRWDRFLARHPRSSVFHSPAWVEALQRTYGFEPTAYTTTPPGAELENGLLLSRIKSRLTGRRLVSLPFSDHCEPLVERPEDLASILTNLEYEKAKWQWKSIEIRPRETWTPNGSYFGAAESFYLHTLNLRPSIDQLYGNLHKDSVQRKIRRAERERLAYEEGQSESILERFYELMLITRRRHELPPAPLEWFRNLKNCLGDRLLIRMVSKNERAIAAVLTLSYKEAVVYKYGCSDSRYHSLGGMPLLLWKTIEDAKKKGAQELDLGRSDLDNLGLVRFKERFGAARSMLTYYVFPASPTRTLATDWKMKIAKRIFPVLPDRWLIMAGRVIYPHIG